MQKLFIMVLIHVASCHLSAQANNFLVHPPQEVLPGTRPWPAPADIPGEIMTGAQAWVDKKIAQAAEQRSMQWHYDFTTKASFEQSITPQRERLKDILGLSSGAPTEQLYYLGLQDTFIPGEVESWSGLGEGPLVATTSSFNIRQVRWTSEPGVWGEGLLLEPKRPIGLTCLVLGHDQQTPEQWCGLTKGLSPSAQVARKLAAGGATVLVPVLIHRHYLFQGQNQQQSYREWLYRQGFHLGRHLIGFELQKIFSAITWLKTIRPEDKITAIGYGDGGLLALYGGALDTRLDGALVSGYFDQREHCWQEPLDRHVWDMLSTFGDAELAAMFGVRPLIIEHSEVPTFRDEIARLVQQPMTIESFTFSGYKGELTSPDYTSVKREHNRLSTLLPAPWKPAELITGPGHKPVAWGNNDGLLALAKKLGVSLNLNHPVVIPREQRKNPDPRAVQWRQVKEIENVLQLRMRTSDQRRNDRFLYRLLPEIKTRRWSTRSWHPYLAASSLANHSEPYRQEFREEIIGHFHDALLPLDPQSRRIYDQPGWAGYEIKLAVFDSFYAAGILLLPKDLTTGEKRPAIVVQHGRNGVPRNVIEGQTSYYDLGARLVTQGYVVFIPQGLFRGEDAYRLLNRKANTIGKTLFSFILAQHEQILNWLWTLSYVDPQRIAFYGKSYGGETAMRIPAILTGYSLSICSGDFGDWTRKVTDVYAPQSFMNTFEWEMPYWRMGTTYSYAEMAYLIFPRPLMVERGHDDLVQPDEWVASEYAKVRYVYDRLGWGDRTSIEWFNGGHASRNEGIFAFLHRHLSWP